MLLARGLVRRENKSLSLSLSLHLPGRIREKSTLNTGEALPQPPPRLPEAGGAISLPAIGQTVCRPKRVYMLRTSFRYSETGSRSTGPEFFVANPFPPRPEVSTKLFKNTPSYSVILLFLAVPERFTGQQDRRTAALSLAVSPSRSLRPCQFRNTAQFSFFRLNDFTMKRDGTNFESAEVSTHRFPRESDISN